MHRVITKIREKNDTEHRQLRFHLDRLLTSFQDGGCRNITHEVLNDLYRYTDYHFNSEERLMRQYGYSRAAEHARNHDEMLTHLFNMTIDLMQDKEQGARQSLEKLLDLTGRHMRTDDRYWLDFIAT